MVSGGTSQCAVYETNETDADGVDLDNTCEDFNQQCGSQESTGNLHEDRDLSSVDSGLGGPQFSSLNKLISYYKDNQLPIDLKSGAIPFTPILKPTSSEDSSDCGIPSISTTRGLRSSDSDLSINRCPPGGTYRSQGSKSLCRRPAVRVFNEVRSLHDLADISHAQSVNVNGFPRRELSVNCISDEVDKNLNTEPTVFPPSCSALQNGALKQQGVGRPKIDRKQIRYVVMNEQPPQINFNISADDLLSKVSSDSLQSPLSLRRSNLYNSAYGDVPIDTGSLANSHFQYVQPVKSGVNSASLPFLTDVYVDPSLFNFDDTSQAYASVPSETLLKPSSSPSSGAFARNSSKPPLPSTISRPTSTVALQLDVLCQGDRFLSLFVAASVVLQPQLEIGAKILLLWLRTVNCLLSEYKDNLSSNGLLHGIFSSQTKDCQSGGLSGTPQFPPPPRLY
ncbi:unnamed protein product [Dibothriocephalus latus]|uniref:Uncharacterized protein n=1 Tax=Dibothriocephalus latus TaxID=60516 RepID=A0A3P6UH53_DIBLA|nr:unnamed protein product [Dibothriocephalus latus]